jgi:hypothetical protein
VVDGPELKNLGPGGRELKNQATAFLEGGTDLARINKLEAELLEMRAINEVLQDDLKLRPKDKPAPTTEFDDMSDDQLRAHIRSLSGVDPKGNVPRKTLIRMAQEQKGNVAA